MGERADDVGLGSKLWERWEGVRQQQEPAAQGKSRAEIGEGGGARWQDNSKGGSEAGEMEAVDKVGAGDSGQEQKEMGRGCREEGQDLSRMP